MFTEFYANLCFNRKRTLDCSMQGAPFANGEMSVLSVTILLSTDASKLQVNNNGRTCTNVEFECRATVRGRLFIDYTIEYKVYYRIQGIIFIVYTIEYKVLYL